MISRHANDFPTRRLLSPTQSMKHVALCNILDKKRPNCHILLQLLRHPGNPKASQESHAGCIRWWLYEPCASSLTSFHTFAIKLRWSIEQEPTTGCRVHDGAPQ
eukprot:5475424-Amphidinium_carterae.1